MDSEEVEPGEIKEETKRAGSMGLKYGGGDQAALRYIHGTSLREAAYLVAIAH